MNEALDFSISEPASFLKPLALWRKIVNLVFLFIFLLIICSYFYTISYFTIQTQFITYYLYGSIFLLFALGIFYSLYNLDKKRMISLLIPISKKQLYWERIGIFSIDILLISIAVIIPVFLPLSLPNIPVTVLSIICLVLVSYTAAYIGLLIGIIFRIAIKYQTIFFLVAIACLIVAWQLLNKIDFIPFLGIVLETRNINGIFLTIIGLIVSIVGIFLIIDRIALDIKPKESPSKSYLQLQIGKAFRNCFKIREAFYINNVLLFIRDNKFLGLVIIYTGIFIATWLLGLFDTNIYLKYLIFGLFIVLWTGTFSSLSGKYAKSLGIKYPQIPVSSKDIAIGNFLSVAILLVIPLFLSNSITSDYSLNDVIIHYTLITLLMVLAHYLYFYVSLITYDQPIFLQSIAKLLIIGLILGLSLVIAKIILFSSIIYLLVIAIIWIVFLSIFIRNSLASLKD